MTKDEKYIARCIQLAKNGQCNAAPNPMVGAVIVHQDTIIGEGYHIRCGEAHAEVNAIRSVKDESLLKDSTIYVSLEPCSHYGKTPPCADLIINKGIPRVVVGCQDPFSLVAGRGIQKMRDAGIDVKVGVLEVSTSFAHEHGAARPDPALLDRHLGGLLGDALAEFGMNRFFNATSAPLYWHTFAFQMVFAPSVKRSDPAHNAMAHRAMKKVVAVAAEHGWGDYRAAPIYQDEVAATYSFNNHALRRFHEQLKDAIDPDGIIAPGRGGIWPRRFRT